VRVKKVKKVTLPTVEARAEEMRKSLKKERRKSISRRDGGSVKTKVY
jgi:hypothetical protein